MYYVYKIGRGPSGGVGEAFQSSIWRRQSEALPAGGFIQKYINRRRDSGNIQEVALYRRHSGGM